MACERSCSITTDRRVMSQYHSFVIMRGGTGTTRPTQCIR